MHCGSTAAPRAPAGGARRAAPGGHERSLGIGRAERAILGLRMSDEDDCHVPSIDPRGGRAERARSDWSPVVHRSFTIRSGARPRGARVVAILPQVSDVPLRTLEVRSDQQDASAPALGGLRGAGPDRALRRRRGGAATSRSTCEERAVTAFIGPSGCGKTTILRTLNRMNDLVPAREGRGLGAFPRQRPLRARRGSRRGAAAHRHGLPAAQSVPALDPRQRAFGPRSIGLKGDMDERLERALAAGRALGRGQGSPRAQRLASSRAASSSASASRAASRSSPRCC